MKKNKNSSFKKSPNPLSFPHEFRSNLYKSTFLDASLLELPNISVDKSINENNCSVIDKILIERLKDNELKIREFIKNQESGNRTLMIDKSTFKELFNIQDNNMLDLIFNQYVQSTRSKFIRKISNSNLSINLSKDFKKKSKRSRNSNSSSSKTIPFIENEKDGNFDNIEVDYKIRKEIDNTLKIPIGGNSFPIPVEYIHNNDNNQYKIEDNSNISPISNSPTSSNSSINNTSSIVSDSTSSGRNSISSSSIDSSVNSIPLSLKSMGIEDKNQKSSEPLKIISKSHTESNNIQIIPTPLFNQTDIDENRLQSHSLPTILKQKSNIQKSKSFSSSESDKLKKIKKSRSFEIESKINLFDVINHVYLSLSKVGTEEEKISSVFKLYDIFGKGFISRDDLKEVLIYRTKQNGLKFQDFTMDSLIDHIFQQFDKNQDGFIDYEEFKSELTINTNNNNNFNSTNSNDNDNLESNKSEDINNGEDGLIGIHNEKESFHSLKRYFKIEGSKLFFISLFLIINSILVVISFLNVHANNKRAIQLFGPGLYITRIAAQLIEFNAAIILITMCKQLFTMIRNTKLKFLFPVDKYMTFHKLIGYTLIIASFLHTIGWIVGMAIATGKPDDIFYDCLAPHFKFRPTVWEMIFNSLPGVTGFIMISFLIIMAILSLKVIRKSNFELFYYSHHLFIGFYVLLILHGTMGWIRPPTFWKWFIVPAFFYTVDRSFRLFKRTHRVEVLDYCLKNEKVINLTFSKPASFDYKPGQYLLINVPHISKLQWHPFTMTSSPLEDKIYVHIRVTGNWTKKLFRWLSIKQQLQQQQQYYKNNHQSTKQQKPLPDGMYTNNDEIDLEIGLKPFRINIDGPFGSSSQYALNQKQVILVGAGIGVSPMASLLKDISLKKQRLQKLNEGDQIALEQSKNETTTKYGLGNLEKVHFFWLNRDQHSFQWFEDLLIDISTNANSNLPKISINTFNTRVFPKNDVRVFMLWNGLDKLFKAQGLDPTTNLPFKTHWGRPNWDTIFQYYSKKYSGESISVFCCGPSQLSKELYEKCRYNTSLKPGGTKFYFHKENF